MVEEKTEFTWSELSDRAKDRVRELLSPDYDWWDSVEGGFTEDMAKRGFNVSSIEFSGFYTQGPYAAWKGRINIRKWCDVRYEETKEIRYMIAAALFFELHGGHVRVRGPQRCGDSRVEDFETYEHDADVLLGGYAGFPYPLIEGMHYGVATECADFAGLHDELQEEVNGTCSDLFRRLEEEYEYLTSDEYLAELCEANEYVFDEDGDFI